MILRRGAYLAFASTLLALLSACAAHAPSPEQAITVIDHVTVLDGRGGAAREDARVTVRGDLIASISPATDPLPGGAKTIDGRGKFLLPGFIDMHAHLLFPRCSTDEGPLIFDRPLSERAMSRLLDFGITTVRSPATPTIEGLKLRDDLNAGRVRGPQAYASAELINDPALSDDQLRALVRDALPYRPDYFKVYARMPPAKVAVVVGEAHRHKIPVIGHLQQTGWAEGAAMGVDHLVHSFDWSENSLPPAERPRYREAARGRAGFLARLDWLQAFDPRTPQQAALISTLARKRISVDVTLIAYDSKFSAPQDPTYRRDPALNVFPELREDWTRCGTGSENWSAQDFNRWQALRPKLFEWVRLMHQGGVLLVSGTDLTNPWISPGESLHKEFGLLAEAGMTPNQILRMTGANAAEALGSKHIGIIEAGRRADLVLLSADPRRDIANTRSIDWVMQGGTITSQGAPSP